MTPFVHLRAHSQYSITDGLMESKDLAKMAAQDGQEAIAITDNGFFGVVPFYEAAVQQGVKPIVGLDAHIECDITRPTEGGKPNTAKLVLLAKNPQGYQDIMALISRSNAENRIGEIPHIKQSWLNELGSNAVVLSGDAVSGEIIKVWKEAGMPSFPTAEMRNVAEFYKSLFGQDYAIELQRFDQEHEAEMIQVLVQLCAETGIPPVATHPIVFAERGDYFAHELRVCVANGEVVNDYFRKTPYTREQYFKTQAEMNELFSDIPVAIENTFALQRRCQLKVTLGKSVLPQYVTDPNSNEDEVFAKLSKEGLERRLIQLFPDVKDREEKRPAFDQRLDYEIGVIQKMGFSGYFLIVQDFINWAKDHDIPVGPGRGSGAGSLVAYALRITNIEPLRYGLLFERFLNPDRVSMPDFDIDFDIFRRGEVIEYIRQRYGSESVSQIGTIGTVAGKGAIRGAGRALSLPLGFVDQISKMINIPPGKDISLAALLGMDEAHADFRDEKLIALYEQDASAKKLLDAALKLEGVAVSIGKHAAGVLIAPGKITDFTPLHLSTSKDDEGLVSHYDKDQVEKAGLVKFDLLGLANLSILQEVERLVNERPEHQGHPLVVDHIEFNDPKVFELFAKGDTYGVFQFASSGMRATLTKARPDCFEDIIAIVSLFRPGPMKIIPEYCARKHGEIPVEYPDPRVEGILKETYGFMVYQEQVMQVAQILAGYSLGGADLLRRAIGKKKIEELLKQRAVFKEGCVKNGLDEQAAEDLFDLIERFADYGFNKSHAAAYSAVSYQTAYFKHYYPVEFYVASLTIAARDGKQDEIDALLSDARLHGLKILPPDINKGDLYFKPDATGIRYGLLGLKNINVNPIQAILKERENGPFESIFDFVRRVPTNMVGKREITSLIASGAFDSLHPNRAALMDSIGDLKTYADKYQKAQKPVEDALIEDLPDVLSTKKPRKSRKKEVLGLKDIPEPMIQQSRPWTDLEQLEEEKKAIGFYFSAHPFDFYIKQLGGLTMATPLDDAQNIEDLNKTQLLAGVIVDVKQKNSAKGAFGLFTIEDGVGRMEGAMFAESWQNCASKFKKGQFIAFEAKVRMDRRGDELPKTLIAYDAFTFDELQAQLAKEIHVAVVKSDLPKLEALVKEHECSVQDVQNKGASPLSVKVYVPENNEHYHRAVLPNQVKASPELVRQLKQTFNIHQVKFGFYKEMKFRPRPEFKKNFKKGFGR